MVTNNITPVNELFGFKNFLKAKPNATPLLNFALRDVKPGNHFVVKDKRGISYYSIFKSLEKKDGDEAFRVIIASNDGRRAVRHYLPGQLYAELKDRHAIKR